DLQSRDPQADVVRTEHMPSAGDLSNLWFNLVVLGQVGDKPGNKLSYKPDAGRFSIDEESRIPGIQGLTRTLWNDSVKTEKYFGEPIRELFAAAHGEIGGAIQPQDITNALNGLRALRNSYTGQMQKLAILDAVIQDAELGVKKDPA